MGNKSLETIEALKKERAYLSWSYLEELVPVLKL